MAPIEFYPNQTFDQKKHIADIIAMEYVKKAASDVHHLVPAEVPADGNCLYHSILLLMNNSVVTVDELRGKYICVSLISWHSFCLNNFSSSDCRTGY